MRYILHITTHMGGGVGKVLSSITTYAKNNNLQYNHKILILENPEKMQFVDICKENNVDVVFASNLKTIETEMMKADIIQLSWWHHPLMAKLLSNFPQIPVRLIIWAHVSGCTYPALPFDFIKIAHKAFFTTNYTFENPYWSKAQREYIRQNAEIIYGAGDFTFAASVDPVIHKGFNIGYVGTLNYSKLHPEFVKFCEAVDIPDVKFIMVGDQDNERRIKQDALNYNLNDKLEFMGYMSDVSKALSMFNVFGYPLNPWHFGTTENALLEAMSAGLPVVALNQCAEKCLINHMETGLLADNYNHYAQLVRYLYESPSERIRIGKNAKEFVQNTFSLEKTVCKMNVSYDEVMDKPKEVFDFSTIFGSRPYEWFLACLGEDRKLFEDSISCNLMADRDKANQIKNQISNCRHILREKSKSSVHHFAKYFPDDENIMYWTDLMFGRGVNN